MKSAVGFAAFTKGALQVDIPELSDRLDNEDGISESWLELHSECVPLVEISCCICKYVTFE